jgi:hypothetical protein
MSHFITLAEASAMTARYRNYKEAILDTNYKGNDTLPNHETFDAEEILTILNQNGCKSLRIYYGMNPEEYKTHAILVGVNEENEDMLPANEEASNTQIAERGFRCPTICAAASALNDE